MESEAEIILTIFLAKYQISAWYSYKIYSYKKTCKRGRGFKLSVRMSQIYIL